MDIDCTPEFKQEFEKLKKNKSYHSLVSTLVDFLSNNDHNFATGSNLNHNDKTPYIKKRINGAGGYRLYYYYIIVNQRITLMFIHPKTGSSGFESVSVTKRNQLLEDREKCILDKDLYKIVIKNEEIVFTHFKELANS